MIVQLLTGALGSVGFGMLFHIKPKYLPLAALGGFWGWLGVLLRRDPGPVMPGDLHILFRHLGDSSDPRKYTFLLHEQYCRR